LNRPSFSQHMLSIYPVVHRPIYLQSEQDSVGSIIL